MSLSTSVRTDHEAPGVGNPLLIGQLVGDAVLITGLVEADPGIPRAAENLRLHEVLAQRQRVEFRFNV
jgi:hypothetical protein